MNKRWEEDGSDNQTVASRGPGSSRTNSVWTQVAAACIHRPPCGSVRFFGFFILSGHVVVRTHTRLCLSFRAPPCEDTHHRIWGRVTLIIMKSSLVLMPTVSLSFSSVGLSAVECSCWMFFCWNVMLRCLNGAGCGQTPHGLSTYLDSDPCCLLTGSFSMAALPSLHTHSSVVLISFLPLSLSFSIFDFVYTLSPPSVFFLFQARLLFLHPHLSLLLRSMQTKTILSLHWLPVCLSLSVKTEFSFSKSLLSIRPLACRWFRLSPAARYRHISAS